MNLLNTGGGGGEKLVQVERTERAGGGHTGERGAQQSGSGGSSRSSGSSGKVQQSSLASVPREYDTSISWVFNRNNEQAANRIFSQALFRFMI